MIRRSTLALGYGPERSPGHLFAISHLAELAVNIAEMIPEGPPYVLQGEILASLRRGISREEGTAPVLDFVPSLIERLDGRFEAVSAA